MSSVSGAFFQKTPEVSLSGGSWKKAIRRTPEFLRHLFLVLHFSCINGIPEHVETVVQELQRQVADHIKGCHQILVPVKRVGQVAASDGGDRGEHAVEGEDLQHGHRHVAGGLEGVPAVQGEIPQNRQDEGYEIAGPVAPAGELIQQGKGEELDDAC